MNKNQSNFINILMNNIMCDTKKHYIEFDDSKNTVYSDKDEFSKDTAICLSDTLTFIMGTTIVSDIREDL